MHGKTQIFLIKQDLKFYQKLKKPFLVRNRLLVSDIGFPSLSKQTIFFLLFFFLRAEIRKFSEIRYVNKF